MRSEPNWIKELFIDKVDLFLKVLNHLWREAEDVVKYIANLLKKYDIDEDSRVLEVGCGNGRIAVNLARYGYRNVYGVDISPNLIDDAINKARSYGVSDRVKFRVCDARDLDKVFDEDFFDAILMYWTSVLGYYLDEEVDLDILRKCRYICKKGGYLFILRTANRDLLALLHSLKCIGPHVSREMDDIIVIEYPEFDPITSTTSNRWVFYKKLENKDLKYIDEISFRIRVYSLHELIRIAKQAGWEYVDSYRSIATLEPFTPCLSGFNIVFKAY